MKKIKEQKSQALEGTQTGQQTFGKVSLKEFLRENLALLCILIGFFLVALSIGPYHNGDSSWEYDAVSGVLQYGLPYAHGPYLMDQPPLGFYIQAGFFTLFGSSINDGTFLVTLFGLGCIILVYGIGKMLYNKTTGLFAALLFAFSPWHLIMSRTFLIDAQCLFFSLLSLFVGIVAVRRGSFKLFMASALVFAAAFNTKLYAVFILVPLISVLFAAERKNLKRAAGWLAAFSIPVVVASFLWYQTITGVGLSSIFNHADFLVQAPSGVVPTYFFVGNLLVSYTLGWFFIDAVILSLLVCLVWRRLFRKFLFLDLMCVATILCIIGVNMYLGVTLDLKSPYLNAIKYDYQALPYFSLLAAGLITKSVSMLKVRQTRKKLSKIVISAVAVAGLVLAAAALFYNLSYVHLFTTWDYMIFRVQPGVAYGYSLFNSAPISANSILMGAQYVGFAVALSGVLWASRQKIVLSLRRLWRRPPRA